MSRLEARAKYSSERERMEAPRTVVVRFVVVEKVVSIKVEGIGVMEVEGRILSSMVSGGKVGISMVVKIGSVLCIPGSLTLT